MKKTFLGLIMLAGLTPLTAKSQNCEPKREIHVFYTNLLEQSIIESNDFENTQQQLLNNAIQNNTSFTQQVNPYNIQFDGIDKFYVNIPIYDQTYLNQTFVDLFLETADVTFDFGNGPIDASWELATFNNIYNNNPITAFRAYINHPLPINFQGNIIFEVNSFGTNCDTGLDLTLTRPFSNLNISINSNCDFHTTDSELLPVIYGGVPPYSYVWGTPTAIPSTTPSNKYSINTNNPADVIVTALSYWQSGTNDYTLNIPLTVTDAIGNSMTVAKTIYSSRGGMNASPNVTNATCSGKNNGSIILNASGGTLQKTYQWSHGPVSVNSFSLAPNTYFCTFTDLNGCTFSTNPISVGVNQILSETHIVTNATNSGNNQDGVINITPINGTAPYTFKLNNIITTNPIQNLSANNYNIKITDVNGCNITSTITVNFDPSKMIINNNSSLSKSQNLSSIKDMAYPNPSENKNFDIVTDMNNLKSFNLYSITGQLIENIDYNNDINYFHIDLSNQPSGTYFLHLIKIDDSIEVIRLNQ